GLDYQGIDLLAGGIPCPPFSIAGKQLGRDDERDLFPTVLRLTEEIRPQAIMIENVRGLLDSRFEAYRSEILGRLSYLGYEAEWKILNARDFGVPQLRPRALLVGLRKHLEEQFQWPKPLLEPPQTVGEVLFDLMASCGWEGAEGWKRKAAHIAPTLVGGSHRHGGPDLGPVRARRAWEKLGVDGMGLADEPPPLNFQGMPRLTLPMVARLQGFPDDWEFLGSKTKAYRQIGNAFPPPVAEAVGRQLLMALGALRPAMFES
ncbi:MAG: DNA (cytosine-5-)-methyltransferase, partial [Chloroflexota bacterium]|nr:DNA (cytosine-5-)-methyltransferase [Chloroflexota bacterium]